MKKRTEIEQQIEALVEADQPLPEDLRLMVEQDEELKCYYEAMQSLMHAFDSSPAPIIPDHLTQNVMDFIVQREQQEKLQHTQKQGSIFQDAWLAIKELIDLISLPPVLKRDAWPTVFASMVIVWSVLIAPQVQANKLHQIVEHPWVKSVDQYTEQVYQKGNQAADRLIQFTEGLIYSAVEIVPQNELLKKTSSENSLLEDNNSSRKDTGKTE